MDRSKTKWPSQSKELAIELHSLLSIDNKKWHHLKNDSERRSAELIAGALVQLISGGHSSDIKDLVSQSILWLNQDIKDPGCPH